MTLAVLNLSWPVFANGLEFGGIYALMAVGIGLVFGVLRLVNFAYGQLIMAGGFALAYGAQWGLPNWVSILFCFGVVLALSVVMDRLVFRPLRTHSPAVMLVATFAVAVLLVEQRAQRTVALADRCHVLANGELRLTLGPDDAADTDRLIAAYLA